MKRHVTEKELIEYQFELASKSRSGEIASHLKDCVDCRQQAEQLKRKFATLDLLREGAEVSDKLISETIEQAKRGTKSTTFLFRKPAWIGAAAVVLLMGLMLLVFDFGRDEKQDRQIAKDIRPATESEFDEALKVASDRPLTEEAPVAKSVVASRAAGKSKARTEIGSIAADKITEAEVPDKPPFAPASAIELVTLPRRDNVQITIYNSADLTLVREKRNLTLKKGWNWLQFMWANTLIDPTSLGLEPLQDADQIDIQQLVFPARLKDIGRWLIRSETEGQVPFEVTYFTSGLSWRAFYMGTLSTEEQKMKLQGYVRIANRSGEDYENAQTRLIVGQVHQLDEIAELAKRQYPYNRPGELRHKGEAGTKRPLGRTELLRQDVSGWFYDGYAGVGYDPKEIRKEGLSEYFLYTIEGTETIPDKWGKRLLSFDVDDITVESLYKYDEERWSRQTIRFLSFINDEEHNLGQTPIPNGNVKIYSLADENGHLSYIGGTNIKYIPIDEEVDLHLGVARLVSVEPILMDFRTEHFVFDANKNITGWDELRTWKIEVTNTRQLPVKFEITRSFSTAYWILRLNGKEVSYEKHDATHARFKLELEPRSKQTFEYAVTTYHGAREEMFTKQHSKETKL